MGMLLLVVNRRRFGPTQETCLQSTKGTSGPWAVLQTDHCSRYFPHPPHQRSATILCRSKHVVPSSRKHRRCLLWLVFKYTRAVISKKPLQLILQNSSR